MRLKTLLKYLLPLIILGIAVLLFLVNNNQLPFLNTGRFLAYPAPIPEAVYGVVLNTDKTITYRFYTARLEKFEAKKYLLNDYIVLTLKPINGNGPIDKTYSIALPADLKSIGSMTINPQELQRSVDKIISFGVTFKEKKTSYSFSDVASWNLFGILK